MAERATLSIDKYVNSPGYMASEITVNPEAFDKIAKTGKLRRDITVVWTNQLPQMPKSRFGTRKTQHPLIIRGDEVVIKVNDDLLKEEAEARAEQRVQVQDGDYDAITKEEFLSGFNREVAGGLKSVLYTDKVSLQQHPLEYVNTAWTAFIASMHLPPSSLNDWEALGVVAATAGFVFWFIDRAKVSGTDRQLLAPARYVRGYRAILQNQSNLIIERDSPPVS